MAEGLPSASAAAAARLARTRNVRRLRIALPAAMGAIVVAVIAWVGVRGLLADIRAEGAAAGGLHMTKPRFFGRDEQGRAYTLQALDAVRDAKTPDRIALTEPRLSLDHGAPQPTTIRSKTGLYTEAARHLHLEGGVRLEDGKGAKLDSPTAEVDTQTGDVSGQGGVTGASPLGQFRASSYLVKGKGAEIDFSGGVQGRFVNQPETRRP